MKQTGVVSEVFPKMAKVLMDGELQPGEERKKLLCTYRRAQVIDQEKQEWRERSPVAPGDRVEVKVLGSRDGVIEEIYDRRNSIQRRAPGREGKILHTIAANLDNVVIVTAYADPVFSPGLVDRFLVAIEQAEIKPVLVINKLDLRSDANDVPWGLYRDIGVQCFPVSTKNGTGIDVLQTFLKHKVSVFCGHSGVGKTSLLHQLFGSVFGKVGEISKATGKGKHTTTVSLMLETADGTRFIDTPGIKEFGLHNIDGEQLIQFFPELYDLQLKHEPYDHMPRYQNYLKIKSALEDEGR
ncbi:MAG: ribosome small subunit-dependent GTPase A [Bdellovibrionales bacterium]|nr:ribosome small subunit-dependent GTPase A [Bdellovibrionales bacterium]